MAESKERVEEEEAGEDPEQEGEEKIRSKTRAAPEEPSEKEREEHEMTHLPYQAWCSHCVAGKAPSEAHRKQEAEEDKMIDEGKYCIDVLNQIKAAKAALVRIESNVLKKHVESCVVESFKNKKALDNKVEIRGFGTFSKNFIRPRKFINPKTKEISYLGETATLHFKPSKSQVKK